MKKVLLVSYLFYPDNAIGAIRPTLLSKFLHEEGYKIEILTANNFISKNKNETRIFNSEFSYHFVNHSKFFISLKKFLLSKSNKVNKVDDQVLKVQKSFFKKNFSNFKSYFIDFLMNLDFFLQFKIYYSKKFFFKSDFDCIFSTYGPLGSHLIGLFLKKKLDSFWIADFRDPMIYKDTPKFFRFLYSYFQRIIVRKCDFITAVSKGYLKRISPNNPNSLVINNGFNDNLLNLNSLYSNDFFSFAYTGALYGGSRDLRVLFFILNQLIQKGIIKKSHIRFYYAGREGSLITNLAKEYNLDDVVLDFGFIDRDKSLGVLRSSRLLVLSSWNFSNEEGVIPGKTYELLTLRKPIILIVSGNKSNSEVSELIKSTNSGICYDSINHTIDSETISNFLKNDYERFLRKKQPIHKPNLQVLNKFSYKTLTQKLIRIIETSRKSSKFQD